ncbi:MAG: TIGR03905 family TSCPD domain-containing protein [Clostridiales bacterium]|nr:TIGR03905 family TSCPD domain-containing protein [Clostridiales bacterium]
MKYITSGTCSKEIDFEVVGGKLHNVRYLGGCNGNLKGIGALVEGMEVNEAISRLKGIKCGMKNTSCPDQLAIALEKYLATANA